MTEKEIIRTSKFLSLILRHEPERVGLKLGEAGWLSVDELLRAVNRNGVSLTLDQLKHIVATSDKKRFALSEDGQRIRASQGHSVEVDLQYPPPPISITDELVEALAEIEHAQWMHWSQTVAADVTATTRDKWQRSWVDYAELTDELKEADRVWARKVVMLFRQRKLIP